MLEVPDNWAKKAYYNLPIDEFQLVADFALSKGFTVAWDADVSEETFDARKGLAFVDEFQNHSPSRHQNLCGFRLCKRVF